MSKFAEPMSRLIDELKKLAGRWLEERATAGILHSAGER